MRFTNILYAQHLGFTFKRHWEVQGKRIIRDTGAKTDLTKLGILVKDPEDILNSKTKYFEPFQFEETITKQDETHPNWHRELCHVYGKQNVLLEGTRQAQVLTNTLVINGFPKNIEESLKRSQLQSSGERRIKNIIMTSHLFDAEQMKLPKVKIPERPAYNLPRLHGISQERKTRILINNLLAECEKLAGRSVALRHSFVDNADFNVVVPKEHEFLQFSISVEKFVTSNRPVEPIEGKFEGELPNLYPIKSTITIPKTHIYTTNTFYPITNNIKNCHPHTIFLNFNNKSVKNVHGTQITTDQFESRTLLNAFGVAACRAKQLYGESMMGNISKPIVVQSIQTDGRLFHFGILQLNTLALDNASGTKNYWFQQPSMALFKECSYKTGKPFLDGYNSEVFRIFNAFYNA